ncbi:MAG TPA: hypothetical protein VFB16_03300 [Bauldia sp.]|nr:hypothetical protein [Bauldia sp.]
MPITRTVAAIACVVAVISLSLGAAWAQVDTRSLLVGRWENSIEPSFDNVPIITEIVYAEDGTYSGIRRTKMGEISRTEVIEGTWSVEKHGEFDFTIFRHPRDGGPMESELLEWDDPNSMTADEETGVYQRAAPQPEDPYGSSIPEE